MQALDKLNIPLPAVVKGPLGLLRERLLRRPTAYVVSFPKSGRTWLEVMVARLLSKRAFIPLEEILNRRHVGLQTPSGDNLPVLRFGHGHRYKYFCQDRKFPRWFYRGARVILLVRDPRDVLVSYFYYQKYQLSDFQGSLSDFVHGRRPPCHIEQHAARCGVLPILNYYNAWVENESNFDQLMTVFYEDMRANPLRELARIADFVGLGVSDSQLADAVEFSSFDNMRKMEVDRSVAWHALPGGSDQKGFKTRKGQVGGYVDEMNPADLRDVERHIDSELNLRFSRYFSNPQCIQSEAG